jgi:hypothetical protein
VVGLGHVTRAGYKHYIILSPFLVYFKWKPHRDSRSTPFITMIKDYRQPPTNGTPPNSIFLSVQTNQQYFSLRTNQPQATSQTNRLFVNNIHVSIQVLFKKIYLRNILLLKKLIFTSNPINVVTIQVFLKYIFSFKLKNILLLKKNMIFTRNPLGAKVEKLHKTKKYGMLTSIDLGWLYAIY